MTLLAKIKISSRNEQGVLKTITPGSQINGLTEDEENLLINSGAAERVTFIISEEAQDADPADYLKILDEEFNATELKEAAKGIGLEFAGNISKENLIKLIIEKGKVEDIIDLEEGE